MLFLICHREGRHSRYGSSYPEEGDRMDLELRGKRAIVTGGSRGIGLAVADLLAAEGADVVLVARDQAALDLAAADIASRGTRVRAVSTDTTDDAAVRRMVDAAAAEFGGVDILVNAAAQPGGSGPVPVLAGLTDDAVRVEVETKVLGYLRCARAVAPYMSAQGWGRIISISGLAARQTGSIAGSIRNAAVAAMTKNLADELGPSGINVTVVHPGMTRTERTPHTLAAMAAARGVSVTDAEAALTAGVAIGRLVTAEEVAAVVTFLASPLSVAITGDAIAAGGGARGPIYY
jgi:NAD(P)-dependent dehydrogenase (short-subunit alcohol dehydrogenase family)